MSEPQIVWSPFQTAFFDFVQMGEGSAILEAVAGSGKTTVIVEGASRMAGQVFMGAYNTKMGRELQDRTKDLPNVQAGTFHSVGFKAVRFANRGVKIDLDEKKCLKIAKTIAQEKLRQDLLDLAGTVAKLVSIAKQRGIGALTRLDSFQAWMDLVEHFGFDEQIPEDVSFEKVIKFAQVVLFRSNQNIRVIDFDDMVYLPLAKGYRTLQFDWVLIDEAQDTNPTRRALAKKMLRPGGRLVAVGDPRQGIFGFTGADNDALDQIAQEFQAVRLPLSITYRCPKAVVRHAQQWVQHIEAAETAPEGSVSELDFGELFSTVRVGDAILCRYNKHLVTAAFQLIRAGVPAKMEGRSIGEGLVKLASRWKVKKLDTLETRLEKYQEREVAKALKKEQETRADQIADRVETLRTLIDRAREEGIDTLEGLKTMIMDLFEDRAGEQKPCVVLSSCHKAKGLEWDRVFLLGREQFMPSQMARRPWQIEQEMNLIYVAVTRAKQHLVEVQDVPAD